MPVTVMGDRDDLLANQPKSAISAPCGVVDTLDFPLDPPDGDRTDGGGSSFGRLSGRYGKYHAGEDWARRGGGSLGTPVYSIGHGQVVYSQPLGWGSDKGTLTVRHTFPDGSTILSFYGHLDPPSVTLREGTCVSRGQQVGRIGRPSSSPHLHFEIRSHNPDGPGPGYWATDPTEAGWEPPSRFIWDWRTSITNGVSWFRSDHADKMHVLGERADGTVVAVWNQEIVGLDAESGRVVWSGSGPDYADDMVLSSDGTMVYSIAQPGRLSVFALPTSEGGGEDVDAVSSPHLIREARLRAIGIPTLLPLPDGGAMITAWARALAVSPRAELLWDVSFEAQIDDWCQAGEQAVLTTRGQTKDVWTVDEEGLVAWGVGVGGALAEAPWGIHSYDGEGIYRLDPVSRTAERIHSLPRGTVAALDIVALSGERLLLTHGDRQDRRFVLLDGEGKMLWHRSYLGSVEGHPQLLVHEDRVFALFRKDTNTSSQATLYELDVEEGTLRLLFHGGTGYPKDLGTTALLQSNGELERVYLSIRGASIVALDIQ